MITHNLFAHPNFRVGHRNLMDFLLPFEGSQFMWRGLVAPAIYQLPIRPRQPVQTRFQLRWPTFLVAISNSLTAGSLFVRLIDLGARQQFSEVPLQLFPREADESNWCPLPEPLLVMPPGILMVELTNPSDQDLDAQILIHAAEYPYAR